MKCPECQAQGLKSVVELRNPALPGDKNLVRKFWDEEGRKHVHDANEREEIFQCSRGHRWAIKSLNPCPERTCTFNREPPPDV